MELGGFAESQEAIDGTEEDFIAFNYCLAEDYFAAMQDEDFELLGKVGFDTIENIMYWLNYDGEIGKSEEEIIKSIPKGALKTSKGRTLEEAVIENENLPFAEIFIYNGNHNPKLYAIVMEKAPHLYYEKNDSLLNLKLSKTESLEEYLEFLKSLFAILEERYNKKKTLADKRKFLEQIRPYIEGINVSKKHFSDDKVRQFIKNMNYNWQKDMTKK